MSGINNNLNARPVANAPIEDSGKTFQSECTAEQQEAHEASENALNCVESNVAKRGRNQRDWDAPCTMMDAVAVAHGAFWGGISTGAVTAATAWLILRPLLLVPFIFFSPCVLKRGSWPSTGMR